MFSGNDTSSIGDTINSVCVKFVVLGGILFVCAWLAEACFKSSGLRQSAAWRKAYIKAIVRQARPACNPREAERPSFESPGLGSGSMTIWCNSEPKTVPNCTKSESG